MELPVDSERKLHSRSLLPDSRRVRMLLLMDWDLRYEKHC